MNSNIELINDAKEKIELFVQAMESCGCDDSDNREGCKDCQLPQANLAIACVLFFSGGLEKIPNICDKMKTSSEDNRLK